MFKKTPRYPPTQKPAHEPRAVFAHYMVGGMEPHQARIDVEEARSMGIDAFALNVFSMESWSTNTIEWLFGAAAELGGFTLFFSFDMNHFTHPSQFFPLLERYIGHGSYTKWAGKEIVSTFWGANLTFGHRRPDRGWQVEYKDALAAKGIQTHFIPAFSDSQCSAETIFKNYKVLDGIMNWESWPWTGGPPDETADLGYLRAADAKYKTFMMSISTHQFKHLASDQNWFRPGALTLPYRMQQVLDLSPHFVQIQTWNDAGESHYMGNVWPNSIHGSPCHAYIDEYPHKAWQILYRSFIVAYKAGARHVRDMRPSKGLIEGAFWYHPHFGDVNVPEDDYGVPRGREWAEGVVNVAIVVGDIEEENVWATVYSGDGDVQIASCRLKPGLNAFKAQEVRPGVQRVLVSVMSDVPRGLASGTGDVQVSAAPKSWNLNYAVVALENV